MDKLDGLSLDLEKQNINKIKELFPEAVEEGKINFDMLRVFLGDEVDESREKYQFTWNGKAKSIKFAQTPSSATLRPCKDKSKNWDTTENLYIEGDNLEVLKQLQKTYYGKIKMIYIDPPYNTGNDFVYNDSFSNSLENYKEQTNQTSSSNPESNGKFHTDWLNMIYPRLILAKNLLTKDGLIFVSIDENEAYNLKMICDEIFGSQNFVANIVWEKRFTRSNNAKRFTTLTEPILVYSKNSQDSSLIREKRNEKANSIYSNPDSDPRGPWTSVSYVNPATKDQRPNLSYDLENPYTKTIVTHPTNAWKYEKSTYLQHVKENKLYWGKNGENTYPRLKKFLSEMDNGMVPVDLWSYKDTGSTDSATKNLEELLGRKIFDFPKPIGLIERIMSLIINGNVDNDFMVLDFFSGSATTAHAVMKLNAEDGGNRKFIMVQLPELCSEKSEAYKAGYKNICEIGEERIRRAGEQIKSEWEKEHPSDGLCASEEKFKTDIGFKVFKLDSTNVIPWDSSAEYNEENLFNLSDVFKSDRTKEDILYEIMLKYGVFDRQVEEVNVNGKTMYRVGKRYMIVCLEDRVTSEDVKAIGELSPKTVIFKENGFNNDNDKINAVYNLEKAGVEDVKCI